MSRIAMGICLALIAAGCTQKQTNDQATHFSNGEVKPVVAVVPVIDSASDVNITWNLSDELTEDIYSRLLNKEKLYIIGDQKVRSMVKNLGSAHNPFGTDLAWTKTTFAEDEFVVFLELLEHKERPMTSKKTSSPMDSAIELNMSVRVRILDLRKEQPEVILQEIIHDSHYIPRQFTRLNFHQVEWGKETYGISPLGLAHAQLTKEISTRIQDYILLAKSR
jgi:hypothetical protein